MPVPMYAFSGESLTRTLIRALGIKEGKWTFITDIAGTPSKDGKDGLVLHAVSFRLVSFDFRVHSGYVDAAKVIMADDESSLDIPSLKDERTAWADPPKPAAPIGRKKQKKGKEKG